MLKRVVALVVSFIFASISGGWVLLIAVLDYAGRADIVSNFGEPGTISAKIIARLLESPLWLPAGLTVLLFLGWAWICYRLLLSPERGSLLVQAHPTSPALLKESGFREETKTTVAKANDKHRALFINFEQAEPYMRRRVLPDGNAKYEVYVRVKNIGNGFLSELELNIVDIRPNPEDDKFSITLAPISNLAIEEYRYVLVGSFSEHQAKPPHPIFDTKVTFADVSGDTYKSPLATIDPPNLLNPALVTLEARALECQPVRKGFKLWVDENRRLYMTEA